MTADAQFVLTIVCPDKLGLVHAVSRWLVEHGCNIIDSDQYGDHLSQRFFMRVHFGGAVDLEPLQVSFAAVAEQHAMVWQIWSLATKPRVLILVSKQDHCLNDLLYRTRNGELPIEIALVASNHRDAYPRAAAADIDFLHLPVNATNRATQEARIQREVEERDIELLVLARYMQILSADLCTRYDGRAINIHHSFLPGFKGARPYHQAHAKGVKLIGATAHYVTADLDEGPIIEQGVERVDHRMTPMELENVGRDIERIVLAQAVRYHAERRVIVNGNRTVVFR